MPTKTTDKPFSDSLPPITATEVKDWMAELPRRFIELQKRVADLEEEVKKRRRNPF